MAVEKVLIANRGEIALRIARTCKKINLPTVMVYSEADRFADHVLYGDEAYWIGGAAAEESYLCMERLIEVAHVSGAKYIHPGYGFLSESSAFIDACQKAGLIWIGPTVSQVEQMGKKDIARSVAQKAAVASVPGSKGVLKSKEEAKRCAKKIGYPVLLKAIAGGGGKGMRLVQNEVELERAFKAASREAQKSFGDGSIYLEKYILSPHHIEVQVFGDGKGHVVLLGERECSIQRRHQKIWEEAPSPFLRTQKALRAQILKAASDLTSFLKYKGVGTVEFIVDEKGHFYFLEMNTRLQVEHCVTEWIYGIDLVEWQIRLAQETFSWPAALLSPRGWAVEARIYAEDPKTFLPSIGNVQAIGIAQGPFVRWDSGIQLGGALEPYYDPMIAKLSVWGQNRSEALARMRVALDEVRFVPFEDPKKVLFQTNLSLLRALLETENLQAGWTTTDFLSRTPELFKDASQSVSKEAAVAVSLASLLEKKKHVFRKEDRAQWKRRAREEGVES